MRECGPLPGWPDGADWFDSVVHQDVVHVEELNFGFGDNNQDKGGATCRFETVYPHLEPLREWKVQAFVDGDKLTLELVTFQDWIAVAAELLDELEEIMGMLVRKPDERLF
ncbi:hypothetical protein PC116_g33965 [Phytophthora cactorum]|nr:hypothetical protein PC116_g33965 [Phytophthora cactorum]